jgi:P pilus assembly chaperone PapD
MLQSNPLHAFKKSISLQYFCRSLIIVFLLQAFFSLSALAQGNLIVMPRRVMFEGNKRSEELNLGNTGKDTATYIISLIHIRMKDDGSFEQINQPDSGQQFADNYLRYFPRRVTLAPNESQVVKLQLIKTNELQPGEYRSHMYFRAVPKELPKGEADVAKDTGIKINIVPVFGISIPTIIRAGESTAKVKLDSLNIQVTPDTIPHLRFALTRTGNMSVYGDISVDHIAPNGKVTQVSVVKGLAVYTPNKVRRCHFLLDKTKGVDYRAGTLRIVYGEKSSAKQVVLAEAELSLAKSPFLTSNQ